jgi:prephenate dehydrogenase
MDGMFELEQARITIVGLGLMGGSLALSLEPHVGHLTAVEPDGETRAWALRRGAVDAATAHLAQGVQAADMIILATPVGAILQIVERLPALRPDGCLVLDLGSTKELICEAMEALPASFGAVGGHPMCGKEVSGFGAAEASLYEEQTFVLCRTTRSSERAEAAARAVVQAAGAQPLFLDPPEHDRLVSLVSHLPYFVASLLMQQAAAVAESDENVWPVSASGFRDTARLSGSDPRMLQDVARTNRRAILARLRQYQENLAALIALLEEDEGQALAAWLEARYREHEAYRGEK